MPAAQRHASCLDRSEQHRGDYIPRRPEDTPLYAVLAAELETFLARRHAGERWLPRFVERELRACLECGILTRGFLRLRCPACREERLVPFSCKGRGFCPACGGRRMADSAA
ncbi:MAG: transposase zinc-binding domain-containing protein [Acidobacteria bacterium]|nr:transposase zinc-binding domain-containing protein [Acidobacteriota bacterium]